MAASIVDVGSTIRADERRLTVTKFAQLYGRFWPIFPFPERLLLSQAAMSLGATACAGYLPMGCDRIEDSTQFVTPDIRAAIEQQHPARDEVIALLGAPAADAPDSRALGFERCTEPSGTELLIAGPMVVAATAQCRSRLPARRTSRLSIHWRSVRETTHPQSARCSSSRMRFSSCCSPKLGIGRPLTKYSGVAVTFIVTASFASC